MNLSDSINRQYHKSIHREPCLGDIVFSASKYIEREKESSYQSPFANLLFFVLLKITPLFLGLEPF